MRLWTRKRSRRKRASRLFRFQASRKDERDVSINRRGQSVGYYVSSAGAVAALALTMLEYPYFWIANALYLGFVVATLVGAAVKIVAYRRGF